MIINIVRKPLIGSVCENITLHNIGGINIDDTKIVIEDTYSYPNSAGGNGFHGGVGRKPDGSRTEKPSMHTLGRFPSNVLLSENVGKILDQQSGITTNTSHYSYKRNGGDFIGGIPSQKHKSHWRTETGGASRFFKVIK